MGKVKAVGSPDALRKVKTPNKRAAKDQNAPKRARSAYIFFTTAVTKKIREANPSWTQPDIMREAANRWKEAGFPKVPLVIQPVHEVVLFLARGQVEVRGAGRPRPTEIRQRGGVLRAAVGDHRPRKKSEEDEGPQCAEEAEVRRTFASLL